MVMEERQRERISKKLLIKADGQSCIMIDLSKNGMRLIIPNLVKKRSLTVNFRMDDINIDMRGNIRWIKKESTVYDQVQFQMGIHFPSPPVQYIRLVEKLLRE